MGSNMPKNRTQQIDGDQKLIAGLNKHVSTVPALVIAGTTIATKDIVATLQPRIDTANAVLPARAGWLAAVQASDTELAKTRTFVSNLKQALLVAFSGQVDALADFGLTAKKPSVMSPETRVAAIAKMKATRAARHTMGSLQKKGIRGDVTGIVVTPVETSPTTPAPTTPATTSAHPS
jgi:hypothetical protein